VNGGFPLEGEALQVAASGHPETAKVTGSEELPITEAVVDAVSAGCAWAALGSVDTTKLAAGLFVKVKESTTPALLSLNSYRIVVGETWNHPNPFAPRHAATQASVRQDGTPPNNPPVPMMM